MSITLIGLGIKQGDLTKSAENALNSSQEILIKSVRAASYAHLSGYTVRALDEAIKDCTSPENIDEKIAQEVVQVGGRKDVCYCVEGAVSEDEVCKIIASSCENVTVCEGVSRVSAAVNAAKLKRTDFTALPASKVEQLKSCRAAVVYGICDSAAAAKVKTVIADLFGEQCACSFVRGDKAKSITVGEIDLQGGYGYDCSAVVEEGEFLRKNRYDFADLVHMIELLRAPGGCPWDRVQTNESIKSNAIEEAYELVDAIERGDNAGILEETGDVLLQAAFHALIKNEQGAFNYTDAITGVVKKLIFRHSHIFGGDKAATESEALGVWDKNKAAEKNQSTFGESVMAVPKNMPACMRAQKVGKRAGKSGMDFLSPVSASEKLWEEVKEMVEAMQAGDKAATFDEAGDVLFAAVNTCRLAGVNCEEALSAATEKFTKRFVECEKLIIADGKNITDLDELELDYYWMRAKNATA